MPASRFTEAAIAVVRLTVGLGGAGGGGAGVARSGFGAGTGASGGSDEELAGREARPGGTGGGERLGAAAAGAEAGAADATTVDGGRTGPLLGLAWAASGDACGIAEAIGGIGPLFGGAASWVRLGAASDTGPRPSRFASSVERRFS